MTFAEKKSTANSTESTDGESTEEESTEEESTEEPTGEEETVVESKNETSSAKKECKEQTISSDVVEVKVKDESKIKSKWWRKRKSIDVFQMSDDEDNTKEIKRTRKNLKSELETTSEELVSEPTEPTTENGNMPEPHGVMLDNEGTIQDERNEDPNETVMEVDEFNTEVTTDERVSSKLAKAKETEDNSSLEELKLESECNVKAPEETYVNLSHIQNPPESAVVNDANNQEDSIKTPPHTSKSTFECELCGKSYGTKASLKTHKSIKHNKKINNKAVQTEVKVSTEVNNLLNNSPTMDAQEEVKMSHPAEDARDTYLEILEKVEVDVPRDSETDLSPTAMEVEEYNTETATIVKENTDNFSKEMEVSSTEPSNHDSTFLENNTKNETETFKCDVCEKPYAKKASMRTHRYKHSKEEREQALKAEAKVFKGENTQQNNSTTVYNKKKVDNVINLKNKVEKVDDSSKSEVDATTSSSEEPVQTPDCAIVNVENSSETVHTDEFITSEQPEQDGGNEITENCEIDIKENKENVSPVAKSFIKASSSSPWFTCSICSTMHFGEDGLAKHMSHNHPGQKSKPICTKCNQTFSRIESLKKHMEKQHKIKETILIDSDTEMNVDESDEKTEKEADNFTEQVVTKATETSEILEKPYVTTNEKFMGLTVSEEPGKMAMLSQIATEIEKLEAKEAENVEKLSKIATEIDKLKSKDEKPKSKWWRKGKGIDVTELQEVRKEIKSSTQKVLNEEYDKDAVSKKEAQEEPTENLDEEFDEVVEDEFEEEDIDSHLEAAKLRLVHSDEKDVEQVAELTEDTQKSMVEPKETKVETIETAATTKNSKMDTRKSKLEAKESEKENMESKVNANKSKVDANKSKMETNATKKDIKGSNANKFELDAKKSNVVAKGSKVGIKVTDIQETMVETKAKAEVKRLRRTNMSVFETVDPKKMNRRAGRPVRVAAQVKKKSVLS